MENIFEKLKKQLIVSCQADEGDPFDKPEYVTLFAKAAILGGAAGIRSRGVEKTRMIVENCKVPVIGLLKSKFEDGYVRITGSYREVEDIITSGCHIIAVDGTLRKREGITGPEFIRQIKKKYKIYVMADISTYEEGLLCADSGADCISSTLSGYTPETINLPKDLPDFGLVEKLAGRLNLPVIAEGKVNTPEYAARMIDSGAWSVVVGTAITRPRIITSWFSKAVTEAGNNAR
jgi:N-acylglucosamine-6-phosphate 2-epimerase